MNYVTYAIPFFVLAMLVEFLYGAARNRQTYRLNDTINSLQLGILSRMRGLLGLGFSGLIFSFVATEVGVTKLDTGNSWVWVAGFILYDFLYYWKHRFGHEWRIMWASHAAHHQSEEYNLSTALRQTGTDYIGFVFYIPLYLVGFPVEVVVTVGSLNLIYQFWVHTEHIRRLGPLEWILVTPSNHRVHHARNPEYIDRNYAGVFIIWDRLFGTFKDEISDSPCVYGITRGLKSWNPFWANFHVWYETFLISLKTRKFSDKFKVWFKGPGWYPADMQPTSNDWRYEKFDPRLPRGLGIYTFIQLWVMIAASLLLVLNQDELGRAAVLIAAFWLGFSYYVHGTLLEGKSYSHRLEWARLAVLGILVTIYGAQGHLTQIQAEVALFYGLVSATGFALLAPKRMGSKQTGTDSAAAQ